MPGFTADASLTGTGGHYRQEPAGTPEADPDTVYPQACSWWEWLVCGTKVSACTTVCSTAGSIAWLPCMTNCLFLIGAAPCAACLT
jgi:hypothetical protein